MNLLKNNLTFAVLSTSSNWKTHLTTRFCEYYCHQINGSNFLDRLIYPKTVDEALDSCTTDYLLVQSSGHITFSKDFFVVLNSAAEEASDIFLSHLIIENEYAELDKRCIFFNVKLWKEAGSPPFYSQVREGPSFDVLTLNDSKIPAQFIIDTDDKIFVDQSCSSCGALIAIKQLELYGTVTSLAAVSPSIQTFYLDESTPYREIYSETFFEKVYLTSMQNHISVMDTDSVGDVSSVSAKLIVAPAQGLKALSLAEHFKSTDVIIYDSNPMAIELQKLIFSVSVPTLYGDVISEFIGMYPNVNFLADDMWESDKFYVVLPSKNINVSYHLIDIFSYEIDNLIRTIDHSVSAVFDFSDIFVYPYNYYKRSMNQVQGLYNELYSLIKSRTGSTRILGYAPNFQHMDGVKVNTSNASFEMSQYHPEPEEIGLSEIVEEMNIQESTEEPVETVISNEESGACFKPTHSINVPSAIPENNYVVPVQISIHTEVQQIVVVDEPIPEPIIVVVEEPVVVIPEPIVIQSPVVEETVPFSPYDVVFNAALNMGYARSNKNELDNGVIVNKTILSFSELFSEFTATYEYKINIDTGEWKFTAGKQGGDKRVEFSNGQDINTLLKHVLQSVKINPKTAVKYF